MASLGELLDPKVESITSAVAVPDTSYTLGGEKHGKFVASIWGGEGVLVTLAELSDINTSYFDPVRKILVMAAAMQ